MEIETVLWCEKCQDVALLYHRLNTPPIGCLRCDNGRLREIPKLAAEVRLQIPNAVHGRDIILPLGLQFTLPVCKSRWDAIAALGKLARDLEAVWAKTDRKSSPSSGAPTSSARKVRGAM